MSGRDEQLGDETEIGEQPASHDSLDAETDPSRELAMLDTIGTLPGRRSPTTIPTVGDSIAHFEVLGTLGVGGMGVVLRARDQLLDREIALKLVRPDLLESRGAGRDGDGQTELLLAEARAMAKISHPNVIVVHEVGVVRGQVFLAMELIEGRTLAAWLDEAPRAWQAIVERWCAAGRGLHAAHAAGLVHRDFKPANVLVDRSERVRVTDFGIAGPGPAPNSPTSPGSLGKLIGTPRYMAPEQLRGEPVDARSDQFAFCVSLWEALYGQHPFDATNLSSLALSVDAGRVSEPPRDRRIPTALRKLIERGLARDRSARHPDMATLVDELERTRRAIERRPVLIGASLAAPLLVTAIALAWPTPAPAPDPCPVPTQGWWVGIWDDARRERVAEQFANAPLPYVRASGPRLQAMLDAYTREWDTHQVEACRDTRVHGRVSEALLDRRTRCLEGARRRVDALARLLEEGEADVLAQALELAQRLPSLAACDDLERLEFGAEAPVEIRERLDAFDRDLARAETLDRAGHDDQAQALLTPWIAELAPLDHPTSEARLRIELGAAWGYRDRLEAVRQLELGFALAIEAGDPDMLRRAALSLALWDTAADDAARRSFWLSIARASYAREGREPDYALYGGTTNVAREARDWPAARAAAEQAMAAASAGTDEYAKLQAEALLGSVCGESRDFECGRRHLGRAVELASVAYGPEHRATLRWRANLIAIDALSGTDYAKVAREAEALLVAQEAGLGPDHAELATTLTILGMALRQLDELERARDVDARALAIRRRALGPTHRLTIESLEKLGRDEIALADQAGDAQTPSDEAPDAFEPGLTKLREVIDLRVELHGATHYEVGRSWSDYGWALGMARRWNDAVAADRKALAIMAESLTPPHLTLITAELNLATALIELGEFDEACLLLERGREQLDEVAADPRTSAQLLVKLALARKGRGAKPEAWREPAQAALALLDAANDHEAELREDLDELLGERP